MFSYRHAFHAGNHADVLKHLTLIAVLRHLMLKDGALTLVDTHAGAGLYRLDGDYAETGGEARDGIAKLAPLLHPTKRAQPDAGRSPNAPASVANTLAAALAPGLADYLSVVAAFNPGPDWRVYPGSPFVMQHLMRPASRDRLRLFELHPTDARTLAGHVAQLDAGREVTMARQDGFEGLKALLPPPVSAGGSRRALVLVDPSYEIKTDYGRVAACIDDCLRRFATGVYLVWYPIIPRPEAHELPRRLRTLVSRAGRPWLHATLAIGQDPDRPSQDRPGLTASGMFVVNPPHTLKATLQAALPQVLAELGRGRGQGQTVETGG